MRSTSSGHRATAITGKGASRKSERGLTSERNRKLDLREVRINSSPVSTKKGCMSLTFAGQLLERNNLLIAV